MKSKHEILKEFKKAVGIKEFKNEFIAVPSITRVKLHSVLSEKLSDDDKLKIKQKYVTDYLTTKDKNAAIQNVIKEFPNASAEDILNIINSVEEEKLDIKNFITETVKNAVGDNFLVEHSKAYSIEVFTLDKGILDIKNINESKFDLRRSSKSLYKDIPFLKNIRFGKNVMVLESIVNNKEYETFVILNEQLYIDPTDQWIEDIEKKKELTLDDLNKIEKYSEKIKNKVMSYFESVGVVANLIGKQVQQDGGIVTFTFQLMKDGMEELFRLFLDFIENKVALASIKATGSKIIGTGLWEMEGVSTENAMQLVKRHLGRILSKNEEIESFANILKECITISKILDIIKEAKQIYSTYKNYGLIIEKLQNKYDNLKNIIDTDFIVDIKRSFLFRNL